jgi:hypothetical protein
MPSAVFEKAFADAQKIAPLLTREECLAYAKQREEEAVFGKGFQRDKHGRPISQGIGSVANPSETHFQAIEKYEGKAAADKARTAAAAFKK